MKRKDLALIAVVVVISTIFSLVISSTLIGSPKKHAVQVEVIEPISTDFPTPSGLYYNKDAIDPTRLITIGNNNNPEPFSKTAQ